MTQPGTNKIRNPNTGLLPPNKLGKAAPSNTGTSNGASSSPFQVNRIFPRPNYSTKVVYSAASRDITLARLTNS